MSLALRFSSSVTYMNDMSPAFPDGMSIFSAKLQNSPNRYVAMRAAQDPAQRYF